MKQNPAENEDRVAAVPENDGETRAFSRRLNAAKEKWRAEYEQELMEKLKLVHPGTGEPVNNVEELMELLDAVSPAQANAPENPETAELRAQLRKYREEEEDRGLRNDRELGGIYQRLYPEVEALATYGREHGMEMGLKAAFQTVLLEHIGEVLQEAGARGQRQAMAQMRHNAASTPASLGGASGEEKMDYGRMSDAEFDRLLQRALNGELRKKI